MPSKRSNVEARIQKIGIDLILECSVQARVRIDLATVSNYAEHMKQKETFPPIIVYRNGEFYFLADGRHRLEAARSLGLLAIECEVRDGTEREALFYAVGSNANHGLPRTNADKRHCVGIVLNDAEWSKQSGREIARMCGVSNTFVSNVRRELAEGPSTIDSKASEAALRPPVHQPSDELEPSNSSSNSDPFFANWTLSKTAEISSQKSRSGSSRYRRRVSPTGEWRWCSSTARRKVFTTARSRRPRFEQYF